MTPTNKDTLNFSVDSSLLFEIGEKLVARQSIALAELIKNSYDADAKTVTITFSGADNIDGVIMIEDNGHGMSLQDIRDNWMTIAHSNKAEQKISHKYNRPLAGAKGIGRFSVRRLGKILELKSVYIEEGIKKGINVTFDWNKFTSGTKLTDIRIPYSYFEPDANDSTGLTLLISSLKDTWMTKDVDQLKKQIFDLQSPFPFEGTQADPGFDIIFEYDGDKGEQTRETLTDELLDNSLATLKGFINEDGIAKYILTNNETNEEFVLDEQLHIIEDESQKIREEKNYRNLEHTEFTIHYFLWDPSYFQDVPFTMSQARKLGRSDGGVRVYIDNFRLSPYGQQGDDWLELDLMKGNINMAKKVAMSTSIMSAYPVDPPRDPYLYIPNNNNLFGWIQVSQAEHASGADDDKENLTIKASREGFLENDTFIYLKNFVQRGIYWMTLKMRPYIWSKEKPKKKVNTPTIKESFNNITENIEGVIREVVNNVILEKKLNITEEEESIIVDEVTKTVLFNINELQDVAENQNQRLLDDLAMLRLLASAGTSLIIMQHQIRGLLDDVEGILTDTKTLKNNTSMNDANPFDVLIDKIENWNVTIKELVMPLGELIARENRNERSKLFVLEIVEAVKKPLNYYIEKYGIAFDTEINRSIRTPQMIRAELYAVLLNLLTNALKAVYGDGDPRILVKAFVDENYTVIQMLNTGKVAPPNKWEKYFEPFEGSDLDHPILGVSTGIGLTVVRDIVESYDGEARFIEVHEPWKTGLEIRLKRKKK